jgi:uncharacterized protein
MVKATNGRETVVKTTWSEVVKWRLISGVAKALWPIARVTHAMVGDRHLLTSRPRVSLPGLGAGLSGARVAHLSDIHHGPWQSTHALMELVRHVNDLEPDLLVLTGDYVHMGARFIEPVFAHLAGIRAPLGRFAVWGNHDRWTDRDGDRMGAAMRAAGVTELCNEARVIERHGARLAVVGVDDPLLGAPDLDAALAGVPDDVPAILLVHTPAFVDHVHDPRVRLALAGHTHGGQLVLPLLGAVSPDIQGALLFFPTDQWRREARHRSGTFWIDRGARDDEAPDGFWLHVSRGIGMTVLPLRIGCPPEVALLELGS